MVCMARLMHVKLMFPDRWQRPDIPDITYPDPSGARVALRGHVHAKKLYLMAGPPWRAWHV